MTSRIEHALALAARGLPVFPIAIGAKHPPLLNGWPQKATCDPEEIRLLWLAVPNANIGIHCEGLLVVDVDPKKGGNESLGLLELQDHLPATLCTRTPSGGRHLFFRLPVGHGGVPNSVQRLGNGLDVRSTGGYVVASGSVVAAGAYAFEDAAREIAPAPQWLVDRAGASDGERGRSVDAGSRVPDAADAVVGRARDWLRGQAPAVEGQGGDARTFAVACGLRDLGVSREQALELLSEWNTDCVPPWDERDLAAKVGNAYRYAENLAGSKAAAPEDFPSIPQVGGEPKLGAIIPKSGTIMTLDELADDADTSPGYVIKGVLYHDSYAEIYGAPGEGKTFVALDMAYHVAAGLAWMSKKVRGGPVLYLAYEGHGGLKKRAKALRQKYGKKKVPLYVIKATFNLREKPGRQELGAVIAALPAKPVLIVIDTFARALMGGDENSAQDVGAFNAGIAALIEHTGACVLIVHHSGKDKSKGARGSSALLGAIDTEIEIDGGQVISRKQRDIELAQPIGFKLQPLMVGMDEDGESVTSCVVESAAVGPRGLDRISGNTKRGFDLLCSRWPDNRPVDPLEWRDACKEFLTGKNLAQRFYDVKKVLLAKGYIEQDNKGYVTRRMV